MIKKNNTRQSFLLVKSPVNNGQIYINYNRNDSEGSRAGGGMRSQTDLKKTADRNLLFSGIAPHSQILRRAGRRGSIGGEGSVLTRTKGLEENKCGNRPP
jgi:hypothetical protein